MIDHRIVLSALAVAAIGIVVVACLVGYTPLTELAASPHIIWELRLPRALLGLVAGAALALAGATLQSLFRNPLADPSIIGVSIGAACGAIVAMLLFGERTHLLPIFALSGAVAMTFFIYGFARGGTRPQVESMLLAGIAVNAVGGAFIGLMLTFVADIYQLKLFVFWTLGSLNTNSWDMVGWLALAVALGVVYLWRKSSVLDLLLLGDAEAYQAGVSVVSERIQLILVSALLAGVTVAACGTIGFIGLVAPHIVRLLLGPSHRILLPASALLGGTLLATADIVARSLAQPAELPIGILTALVGGPFFLWLLRQKTIA